MHKILLRFDDICPTMNYQYWNRAKELLDQFHIKPLLGVIPDCQDPALQIDNEHGDFWVYIKSLQEEGYTIAMHGYKHVYDSTAGKKAIVTNRPNSEFAGHSYIVQEKKIRAGKEIMEDKGIHTDIFFAPGHSYDSNTLKALYVNGFHYMSDGKTMKPINRKGIVCLPCKYSVGSKLEKKISHTVVFHTNKWGEAGDGQYRKMQMICEELGNVVVDFETYKTDQMGNSLVQIFYEKCFLMYERYVFAKLRKIKHMIIRA